MHMLLTESRMLTLAGATKTENMFAGMPDDPNVTRSLGLFESPNRVLAPGQGRWLSPDPAANGWNQYAYPTNPNSFTDPSGLCPVGSADAGKNGWDAASGTDACGGIAVNAPFAVWVDGVDGWSTWDGIIPHTGAIPTGQAIFGGQDAPYWGSLASQIAGLLSSIMPCQTDIGAPCNPIGPMGWTTDNQGYQVGQFPGETYCPPGGLFVASGIQTQEYGMIMTFIRPWRKKVFQGNQQVWNAANGLNAAVGDAAGTFVNDVVGAAKVGCAAGTAIGVTRIPTPAGALGGCVGVAGAVLSEPWLYVGSEYTPQGPFGLTSSE